MLTWEQTVTWAKETESMQPLVKNCYYDDPIELAAKRFYESEEWVSIQSILNFTPQDKVLEVGAGRGIMSWAFAKSGCEVYALEPDPSFTVGAGAIKELCNATGTSIHVVEEMGEQLPFDADTFDYVVCRAVLHHATDLKQMCQEIARVLKPGGKFLAVKEHIAETPEELQVFLDRHPLHYLYGGENAYSLIEYQSAIRTAGLKLCKSYAPFEHPVSWAPLHSRSSLIEQLYRSLSQRLPKSISKRLSHQNTLFKLYCRWLNFRCKTPGREYSFLASKI
ncbi:class I SAM-dependent methyltransferase [Moorena sp. SIO4A5]|uniref:class I SAM-dependent methyltransferase n=1 Tax=Moorena sp. SIO4A5 TaxID=2607838 RepID=UPI0013CCA8B4|nr:class I SAM-dependent methyltransferase [Moorena sp. SIO4A5]NEO21420.1 class I SAM-dependent methyltransferase [Moorena sp. SIO4A5]